MDDAGIVLFQYSKTQPLVVAAEWLGRGSRVGEFPENFGMTDNRLKGCIWRRHGWNSSVRSHQVRPALIRSDWLTCGFFHVPLDANWVISGTQFVASVRYRRYREAPIRSTDTYGGLVNRISEVDVPSSCTYMRRIRCHVGRPSVVACRS